MLQTIDAILLVVLADTVLMLAAPARRSRS
jgi:hypothetical protein